MALNAGSEPAPVDPVEPESRRERQERISRAMGQLLLRGYRMLGRCCPHCGTILLQDKEQRLLCVSCQGGEPAPPCPDHCEVPPPCPPPEDLGVLLGAARAAVLVKLGWATRELGRSASAEGSTQLCTLLRACADALGGLQALAPPGSAPP